VDVQDFATFFWQILSETLPLAVKHPNNSEQLFNVAEIVYRSVCNQDQTLIATEAQKNEIYNDEWSTFEEWGNLLVNYKRHEV
jgi:hypothetical protein